VGRNDAYLLRSIPLRDSALSESLRPAIGFTGSIEQSLDFFVIVLDGIQRIDVQMIVQPDFPVL
jgi:hypothetical protein